jgi:hypothetical protein
VGSIGGNAIYAIKATEMFPIKDATAEAQEKRSSLSQIWYASPSPFLYR